MASRNRSLIEFTKILFGLAPFQRRMELFWNEPRIETAFIRMSLDTLKSFGVAILTAGADLDAAAHGIPRRICPFDARLLSRDFCGGSASAPNRNRLPNSVV